MMGWDGGWWVIGMVVMVTCMWLMGRMMMGHGRSEDGGHGNSHHGSSEASAGEILAARFARGEISEEEFEQRRRVLEHQP